MTGNMTGQLLNNRYLVGERVGLGGMAEVYQGQDTVLGRIVAIKVMLPQYAEDPSFTTRFRQEAASAANLQSPYIVNVYDWGRDPKTPYIVMEYLRGSDLKTAINERGKINQRKVAEIGSQVAQALSVAHGLDIIHRDIKPQNIMIQPDGNVKVMDFGIARAKNSMMDKTDAVLGTAHYISPEQAQGKDLSPASDIYSLGVVMYEAATGQLPFDGPDAVSVAMKQVNEEPAPLRELLPNINPDLEAIITKAMSKNPEERFATALDMRQALNDYLSGRTPAFLLAAGAAGLGAAGLGATMAMDGQTAVMGDGGMGGMPTQTVTPIGGGYQTEKTSVMSAADLTNMGRGGNGGPGGPGNTGRMRTYGTGSIGSTGSIGGRGGNGSGGAGGKGGKGNGKRNALIAVAAVAAVAVIALLAFLLLGKSCSPAGGEVPDLSGKTLTEATEIIKDAGFELGTVDYVYDDEAAADTVISQTPRAGTHQNTGTKITLTVSQGAEQVTVPDLDNMTANEARAALQKAGLKYEAGAAEHSDTVSENRVMRQSPEAGKKVDKGTTVTYILSAGKERVEVPNVVGAGEGSATATLNNAGFEVAVDYQSSSTVEEGLVISQTPSGSEKAVKGSTVSIIVSSGIRYYTASAYVSGAAGGSVSPQSANVADGGSVTFYITTDKGYQIASVTDSNGNSYGTSSTVTVSDVRDDVSISVTFTPVATTSSSASAAKSA